MTRGGTPTSNNNSGVNSTKSLNQWLIADAGAFRTWVSMHCGIAQLWEIEQDRTCSVTKLKTVVKCSNKEAPCRLCIYAHSRVD